MALGTIDVEVGAGAAVRSLREIIDVRVGQEIGNVGFVWCRRKEAELVEGGDLVGRPAGDRVKKIAIEVAGFDAQHRAGNLGVTGETFGPAGKVPIDRLAAAEVDGLVNRRTGKQVGVGVVGPPLVGAP